MTKEEMRREKSRVDFEEGLKEMCGRCGRWDFCDDYGFCERCGEEGADAYEAEYYCREEMGDE